MLYLVHFPCHFFHQEIAGHKPPMRQSYNGRLTQMEIAGYGPLQSFFFHPEIAGQGPPMRQSSDG